MTSIPTLTPRGAREQTTFRTLLDSMAHPGSVKQLDVVAGMSPLVAIAEALVDHEVTFAVVPDQRELTDAILRQTGSHIAGTDVAQYVFCGVESLEAVLREALEGTWEYPDAGATVVCLTPGITAGDDADEGSITVSGPGIRDTASVRMTGFSLPARRTFMERNAMRPLGLDLVMVTADGRLVSFSRYMRIQEE